MSALAHTSPTPASVFKRAATCGVTLELRVVPKDPRVEPLELGRRLEAELIRERAAGTPVRIQRLRLPIGRVQREHQLRPQPLTQRVAADEGLELRDELPVSAECELRPDQVFGRNETEFLQAGDFGLE